MNSRPLLLKQGLYEYYRLQSIDLEKAADFGSNVLPKWSTSKINGSFGKRDLHESLLSFSEAINEQNLSLLIKDPKDGSIVGVCYLYDHCSDALPIFTQDRVRPLAAIRNHLVGAFHTYLESCQGRPESIAECLLLLKGSENQNQNAFDGLLELIRHRLIQSGFEGLVILSPPNTSSFFDEDGLSKDFYTGISLETFSYHGDLIFRKGHKGPALGENEPSFGISYVGLHNAYPAKPAKERIAQYEDILKHVHEQKSMMLGKPGNMDFDFTPMAAALQVFMNNSGQPFTLSSHRLDTKALERKLIYFFSQAYGLEDEETYGYVTSGGSEAMEYGLWTGFKKLGKPIVLLSEETHYAALTILKKFDRPYKVIPCNENGEMDYAYLAELVKDIKQPIIVIANIGSTMKGAIDDVDTIKAILKNCQHYIHADAALHGAFMPFLPNFLKKHTLSLQENIDSLSISLHKFLGNVTPAGLVITPKKNLMEESYIEYIASDNQTLSCSRSGLAVLLANYRLDTIGWASGLKDMASRCISLTTYLVSSLRNLGVVAQANESSNIVFFPSLTEKIATKWMLPNAKGISHVVVMPHVTKALIDQFLDDVRHLKSPEFR